MNASERVLLYECTGKGFTIRMQWKGFYYMNALERVLLERDINALERDLQ